MRRARLRDIMNTFCGRTGTGRAGAAGAASYAIRRTGVVARGFDWKAFVKSVMVIAVPVALQNLLTTTGSMIDTMMIS